MTGVRRVTGSKFHTEDPQILGATINNSVAQATWCQEFMSLHYMMLKVGVWFAMNATRITGITSFTRS
jgi:hypothetical protein